MKIITSGYKYLDIDAYAGCIAYAELLQKLGLQAQAASTAPLNKSIPGIVREWPVALARDYKPTAEDTFTLIDVSNPDYFDTFVDATRVEKILDHHPGLEDYWQQRIGKGAVIEKVGAACTQVFECWVGSGLLDHISETSARLLICGILDNTLNFGADISGDRDKQAYEALSKYAHLPEDWTTTYFEACQKDIMRDIAQTVVDDSKQMDFKTYPHTIALGQVTIWDAKEAANDSFEVLKSKLEALQPNWCMNIISIADKKSYFVSDVPEIKRWLEELLAVHFDGNVAAANRMWLRKEIMKADLDASAKKP